MKNMNSTSFHGLENQKTLESFWQKEFAEDVDAELADALEHRGVGVRADDELEEIGRAHV